ncbi:uncharacterized protein LOC115569714 [Scomber scombrus]|uniref:Uncharacterized protein LOC115569714 n=1 Tax=Scomber scombrus TaxID=13677 RepID=A0AAV1NCI7_SCOSC
MSPVATAVLLPSVKPDNSTVKYPEVFPTCTVTYTQSRAEFQSPPAVPEPSQSLDLEAVVSLSDLPLSVSCSEVVEERLADPSLAGMFDHVHPVGTCLQHLTTHIISPLMHTLRY